MMSLAARLAGILCALACALPAFANDLEDAAKHLKAGQHKQALERVNKALAAKPRDPQARFLKGLILTEQGNSKEAIDIFTKLTQDYPELPEPYNNLAVIYASEGQQVGLTPVIISDEIEWSDAADVERERAALAGALEQWRADWQSRDTERYLAHYSSRFAAPGQNLEAWGAHKRKVNGAKQWIKVGLSRVAMFRYPRERDFVVVTFDQDYKSSGLSNVMRKRQYWVKEGASWKIIYEGAG